MKFDDSVALILGHKGSYVHAIGPNATVFEALEKLAAEDIGALVVLDGTHLVGILSERDYVRKVFIKGHSSKDMLVHEIMSSPVLTVEPRTTVDDCMRSMTNARCRHLVVVEDGSVVGVVSIGDLVNRIITAQDTTIHQLEDYICGKYPG